MAVAVIATSLIVPGFMSVSGAADGTGVYGAWALDAADTSKGAVTFTGTLFPNATITSSGQNLSVAKSATLTASTPFGAAYGASTGKTYLSVGLAAGVNRANVTITFDQPPIAGTYGLVMGDVDAENVILSAVDASGRPVSVQEWNGTDFNYAGGTDLPKWDGATGTITGNGVDTQGASMWIVPGTDVKAITLTQTRTSGFPAYQLWIAADVITTVPAATPKPTATAIPSAPAGKVTICHRTSSAKNPYVLMTIDDDAVLRRGHDGHTGGVFPARPWGDIIPPFPGYAGMNWPAGAPILNNGCDVAGEEPIPAGMERTASPTPSATGDAKSTASPSTSGSGSPSASSATPSGSATTTASPTATSITAGPTTAPTAGPSASPSSSPSTAPSTATPKPSPTVTLKPSDPTPIVVSPDGPTVIPPDLVPPGGRVIDVVPPPGGSAEVTPRGEVNVTPAPGSTGGQVVTLVVQQRDGSIAAVPVSIRVGKRSLPCVTLPASLTFGTTALTQATGTCQPVRVSISCSPLARTKPSGDVSPCATWTTGGRTYVRVSPGQPLGVRLSITGPATGNRPAIDDFEVYFVRR